MLLYVRYVHLTKMKNIHKRQNPSSRQRGCYIRTITARVRLQKKSCHDPHGARHQGELIGGKPQS
jgi:hypothetical protein